MIRELRTRLNAPLHYHEWIKYHDANGRGLCEPEAFIILRDRILLFEAKLTGGFAGKMQLEGLYAPLLEFIFKRPVHSLLICKWTTPETPGPFFDTPEKFILSEELFGTWHWLA